ncbi:MAG TPA: sterol desaturase family protein [Ignavibacteria bacterium]|nr:sterol desaturase family protein [Bacteroidota bacterium]HRI84658.1 sterol desaturase family protein [Ignavibacteria bacterium]HRJ99256.1 sterol desaturase family protein [Ignavibacteria bacterium]
MSLQLWSLVIISFAAVMMVVFEKLYPYTKGQKIFREGFFNDIIMYSIVQSYFLGLIIFGILNYIKDNTDLYRYSLIGDWPVWAQVLFFVITHDFYIYWFHRWQHNNRILWRVHEAHHSPKTVDWLSGARSHSFEIMINQTVEFAPIILLGAAPEVAIYKGMISAIWGMFIHSNIDVRLGKIQYFINGPEMHRWHHSDDGGKEYQNNYGTKLAVWDWIFGTAFLPDPHFRKPEKYGLSDTPDYPLAMENDGKISFVKFIRIIKSDIFSYFKQHTYAFRKFKK